MPAQRGQIRRRSSSRKRKGGRERRARKKWMERRVREGGGRLGKEESGRVVLFG